MLIVVQALVELLIDGNLDARSSLNEGLDLVVRHDYVRGGSGQRVHAQTNLGVCQQVLPGAPADNHTGERDTAGCGLTLDALNITDGVGVGVVAPLIGAGEGAQVLALPGVLRVVVVVVRHRLTRVIGRGDGKGAVGEQSHTHDFRSHHGTLNEVRGVVENASDDAVGKTLVVRIQEHEQVLAVLFAHTHSLTEERHLGGLEAHAATVAEQRLGVKCRGLKSDGQVVRTLNPLQLEAGLLLGGEQTLAHVGHTVGRDTLIVCGNRLSGYHLKKGFRHFFSSSLLRHGCDGDSSRDITGGSCGGLRRNGDRTGSGSGAVLQVEQSVGAVRTKLDALNLDIGGSFTLDSPVAESRGSVTEVNTHDIDTNLVQSTSGFTGGDVDTLSGHGGRHSLERQELNHLQCTLRGGTGDSGQGLGLHETVNDESAGAVTVSHIIVGPNDTNGAGIVAGVQGAGLDNLTTILRDGRRIVLLEGMSDAHVVVGKDKDTLRGGVIGVLELYHFGFPPFNNLSAEVGFICFLGESIPRRNCLCQALSEFLFCTTGTAAATLFRFSTERSPTAGQILACVVFLEVVRIGFLQSFHLLHKTGYNSAVLERNLGNVQFGEDVLHIVDLVRDCELQRVFLSQLGQLGLVLGLGGVVCSGEFVDLLLQLFCRALERAEFGNLLIPLGDGCVRILDLLSLRLESCLGNVVTVDRLLVHLQNLLCLVLSETSFGQFFECH
nr:MAG TPA: hypothetical protein [Caudoviricetes sp.]